MLLSFCGFSSGSLSWHFFLRTKDWREEFFQANSLHFFCWSILSVFESCRPDLHILTPIYRQHVNIPSLSTYRQHTVNCFHTLILHEVTFLFLYTLLLENNIYLYRKNVKSIIKNLVPHNQTMCLSVPYFESYFKSHRNFKHRSEFYQYDPWTINSKGLYGKVWK